MTPNFNPHKKDNIIAMYSLIFMFWGNRYRIIRHKNYKKEIHGNKNKLSHAKSDRCLAINTVTLHCHIRFSILMDLLPLVRFGRKLEYGGLNFLSQFCEGYM